MTVYNVDIKNAKDKNNKNLQFITYKIIPNKLADKTGYWCVNTDYSNIGSIMYYT